MLECLGYNGKLYHNFQLNMPLNIGHCDFIVLLKIYPQTHWFVSFSSASAFLFLRRSLSLNRLRIPPIKRQNQTHTKWYHLHCGWRTPQHDDIHQTIMISFSCTIAALQVLSRNCEQVDGLTVYFMSCSYFEAYFRVDIVPYVWDEYQSF